MAIDITNHKCPACTGPLHYLGASGMLECDYCGSKYTVEEIEKLYAEDVAEAEEGFTVNEEKKKKERQTGYHDCILIVCSIYGPLPSWW